MEPSPLKTASTDELLAELKGRSDTFFYSFYFPDRQAGFDEDGNPIIQYEAKSGISYSSPELGSDLVGGMLAAVQFLKKEG